MVDGRCAELVPDICAGRDAERTCIKCFPRKRNNVRLSIQKCTRFDADVHAELPSWMDVGGAGYDGGVDIGPDIEESLASSVFAVTSFSSAIEHMSD